MMIHMPAAVLGSRSGLDCARRLGQLQASRRAASAIRCCSRGGARASLPLVDEFHLQRHDLEHAARLRVGVRDAEHSTVLAQVCRTVLASPCVEQQHRSLQRHLHALHHGVEQAPPCRENANKSPLASRPLRLQYAVKLFLKRLVRQTISQQRQGCCRGSPQLPLWFYVPFSSSLFIGGLKH